MTSPIPPSMDRFGDELRLAVRREQRADCESLGARARLLQRPRALAGGALGLAAVSAAAVLAFGGATAAPALAVTHQADGSVLVTVNLSQTTSPWVNAANNKLAAMGIHEQILIGASPVGEPQASSSTPVSCAPITGPSSPTGPPIEVKVTGQVPTGNTGSGATGITGCGYMSAAPSGAGNTGAAS